MIPTRSNAEVQREIDPGPYRERNLVERFWAEPKQNRRAATRYERTARNFLAYVRLCSAMILLQ